MKHNNLDQKEKEVEKHYKRKDKRKKQKMKVTGKSVLKLRQIIQDNTDSDKK